MVVKVDGQTYPDLASALRDLGGTRRHKYGAQPVELQGIHFDSTAEAQRYAELQLLAAAGAIHALRVQPRYELQPAFTAPTGETVRAITYKADFEYQEDGRTIVEDVKGVATPVFRLKAKLFRYRYPELELRITYTKP